VVGWAIVMLLAGFVALSNNTTWSGNLEADRVAGFLADVAEAFLWSFFVLLLLAWIRARGWRERRPGSRANAPAGGAAREPFEPFPWTDRWLRDWREDDAQRRTNQAAPAPTEDGVQLTCRHGAPLDAPASAEQAPMLRSLSVSHHIVRPGASVSVTWCFESGDSVVVDGQGGYPSCGEALVRIDRTRRIGVVGRNRHGSTAVSTAAVVAMTVPQLHLPTVESPPPVSLRTDVAATVGASTPITQRLDEFWATQEQLRPRIDSSKRLVGVPPAVIDGLRRPRRPKGEN
jgi:hypothetical protein